MPLPILPVAIPVVAALGAGTLGYFIGRAGAEPEAGAAMIEVHEAPDQDGPEDDDSIRQTPADQSEAAEIDRGGEAGSVWANMTTTDALKILELPIDATSDAIRENHRRIVEQVRPDRGGSRYLVAVVDRARDELLDLGDR